MLILENFLRESDVPPSPAELLAALDEPGLELSGGRGDLYRSGQWRHPDTGAACLVDVGRPDLGATDVGRVRSYPGWRSAELTVQVALTSPHWHCLEVLGWLMRVHARLAGDEPGALMQDPTGDSGDDDGRSPAEANGHDADADSDATDDDAPRRPVAKAIRGAGRPAGTGRGPRLRILDLEDTGDGTGGEGPVAIDPGRILHNWHRLQQAQLLRSEDWPRMTRSDSVALWRYRRARARASSQWDHLIWPQALVLLDPRESVAIPTAFWIDPRLPFALPPVSCLVVRRGNGEVGVLPADELLIASRGGRRLGDNGAVEITPNPAVIDLHARATLQPVARYRSLGDGDWTD